MHDIDSIRHARIYLTRVATSPAWHLCRLVAELGPVAAAELVRAGDAPAEVAAELRASYQDVRVHNSDLGDQQRDITLVIPEDTDLWPAQQFRIPADAPDQRLWSEPLALWVRGSAPLPELLQRSVSVTGSRAASGYGSHVAAELGSTLSHHGITTVSGAAYGCDGQAHRGALCRDGRTVAVLACGIDIAYPVGHRGLLDNIAAQGAIVTQYPPQEVPSLQRFRERSKVIAAFSPLLVVVEAGPRSGAIAAARDARSFGRGVMAVPGPITSASSRGTNQLLHDMTALAVTDPQDVIDAFEESQRPVAPRVGT